MDWQRRFLEYAESRGRNTFTSELGIGIEYEDGCDAFWVLPGEVMSTIELPGSDDLDVDGLLQEYDRISQLRRDVLHVVRHDFAANQTQIIPSRDGNWWFDAGVVSGGIGAGAELTHLALQSETVQDVVANWPHMYWRGETPTPMKIERYLAAAEPVGPTTIEQTSLMGETKIVDALQWLGVCRVLQNPKVLGDEKEALRLVKPHGRVGVALAQVAERLPDASASFDLARPGTLCIDYSDGNDTYDVELTSQETRDRFRSQSPKSVGDELFEEYMRLDRARSATLGAIWEAAKARNWNVDRAGSFMLLGNEPTVWLGATDREVEFPVGAGLTQLLRDSSPEGTLRDLFSGATEFCEECLQALTKSSTKVVSESELPRVALRQTVVPRPVTLKQLDLSTVSQMDGFADDAIRECLTKEETLWKYRSPEFFNPSADVWFPIQFWQQLAEGQLDSECPHATALLILLECGDERADELARNVVSKLEYGHHEAGDDQIELVWRYRHEFPKIAQVWLGTDGWEEYDTVRARLGDPVAKRRQKYYRFDEEDEEDERSILLMPPEKQAEIHRDFATWARTEHRCSPIDVNKLRVAGRLKWLDVFDLLEQNPHLAPGLLDIGQRGDCFDEPGILLGGDLLLVWSLFAPSTFLAQLIATACSTDLVALATIAAERDAEHRPEIKEALQWTIPAYKSWAEELQPNLAIAWKRCRYAVKELQVSPS